MNPSFPSLRFGSAATTLTVNGGHDLSAAACQYLAELAQAKEDLATALAKLTDEKDPCHISIDVSNQTLATTISTVANGQWQEVTTLPNPGKLDRGLAMVDSWLGKGAGAWTRQYLQPSHSDQERGQTAHAFLTSVLDKVKGYAASFDSPTERRQKLLISITTAVETAFAKASPRDSQPEPLEAGGPGRYQFQCVPTATMRLHQWAMAQDLEGELPYQTDPYAIGLVKKQVGKTHMAYTLQTQGMGQTDSATLELLVAKTPEGLQLEKTTLRQSLRNAPPDEMSLEGQEFWMDPAFGQSPNATAPAKNQLGELGDAGFQLIQRWDDQLSFIPDPDARPGIHIEE